MIDGRQRDVLFVRGARALHHASPRSQLGLQVWSELATEALPLPSPRRFVLIRVAKKALHGRGMVNLVVQHRSNQGRMERNIIRSNYVFHSYGTPST